LALVASDTPTSHLCVPCLQTLDEDEEWEVLQLNADSQLEGWSTPDQEVLLQAGNHLPLKLQLLGRQLRLAGPDCYQDVLQGIRDYGQLPADVTQQLDAAFITSYRALPNEYRLAFLDIAMFMHERGRIGLASHMRAPMHDIMDWCNAIHGDPVHGRMSYDVVRALERRALVTWAGGRDDPVGVHDELRDFVLRYVQPLTTVLDRRWGGSWLEGMDRWFVAALHEVACCFGCECSAACIDCTHVCLRASLCVSCGHLLGQW
jgi:hypothetical protein